MAAPWIQKIDELVSDFQAASNIRNTASVTTLPNRSARASPDSLLLPYPPFLQLPMIAPFLQAAGAVAAAAAETVVGTPATAKSNKNGNVRRRRRDHLKLAPSPLSAMSTMASISAAAASAAGPPTTVTVTTTVANNNGNNTSQAREKNDSTLSLVLPPSPSLRTGGDAKNDNTGTQDGGGSGEDKIREVLIVTSQPATEPGGALQLAESTVDRAGAASGGDSSDGSGDSGGVSRLDSLAPPPPPLPIAVVGPDDETGQELGDTYVSKIAVIAAKKRKAKKEDMACKQESCMAMAVCGAPRGEPVYCVDHKEVSSGSNRSTLDGIFKREVTFGSCTVQRNSLLVCDSKNNLRRAGATLDPSTNTIQYIP